MIVQKIVKLPPLGRGVHLIDDYLLHHIDGIEIGLVNIFLKHTSASLAINENADPDVRRDVETFLRSLVPDCWDGFEHTLEGCDDMPAHMKNILVGPSLTLPIRKGRVERGIWQGIYLLEHRDSAGQREIVITSIGE